MGINILAVSMFGFGAAAIEIWHTQLPVWAFIFALILGASLNTPSGLYLVDALPSI